MNKTSEAKLQMENGIKDLLLKFVVILTNLPGFTLLFASYTNNLMLVQNCKNQQELDRSGYKDIRDLYRVDAINRALDIIGKVVAFCKITGNLILIKEISYSKYQLERVPDDTLISILTIIYERTNANLTGLTSYGITAATLTEFKTGNDKLLTAMNNFLNSKKDSVQNTEAIDNLLKANDVVLDKIDALINIIKTTQPTFYNTYWETRKCKTVASKRIQLKISTFDADGNPIQGVKITITPDESYLKTLNQNTDRMSKPIQKKTSKKGRCQQKNLAEGIYTYTASKLGHQTITGTFAINNGETTQLNIDLPKE